MPVRSSDEDEYGLLQLSCCQAINVAGAGSVHASSWDSVYENSLHLTFTFACTLAAHGMHAFFYSSYAFHVVRVCHG